MKSKPQVLAWLTCDGVHIDPGSGKYTILGVFSNIHAREFPVTHPHMVWFLTITDVPAGAHHIRISIGPDPMNMRPLIEHNFDSPGPVQRINLTFNINNLNFDAPGDYSIVIEVDDEPLLATDIMVAQYATNPAAPAAAAHAHAPVRAVDLIGVGAPIMDLIATVPESFLANAGGEKGGMVMVDAAEMARLLALLPAKPAMSTGGSAANTTFNIARLGLRPAFIGKLGNDDAAAAYKTRFASVGIDITRFKHAPAPDGRCLALTTPDAQRTMRTCLGAHGTFSPADIAPADFAGARHVHLEGYLVFNPALADAILAAARAAGCTISLDLASFEVVRESREWILGQLLKGKGIDVVFCNEDEIRALFPDASAPAPAKPADVNADTYRALALRLAAFGGVAAVKLGKDGAWLARGTGAAAVAHRVAPQRVTDAIDTNGAGDAWAAGFLSAWLRGKPLPVCGQVASLLGAETVRHMGPLIPDAAWPQVRAKAMTLLAA